MTPSIIFSDHWNEICAPRMGVAKLTRMAFEGQDMRALWHALMDQASDDVAGSGMGMDLSVISQLLGDQPTGLAIQKDTLAFQRLYRSPCAAARPRLRVLALAAVMDIGGNTPLEFLMENSDIALVTYYVVPGTLPCRCPSVMSPSWWRRWRCGAPSMQAIAALAAHWPRPILDAPAPSLLTATGCITGCRTLRAGILDRAHHH